MKNVKNCIVALLLLMACATGFAQAKKPTIMIVPSDVWCTKNGYMTEYDNQGTKTKIPDYKRAFQENADLLAVIAKINGIMADRGFPLKDMASAIKTQESEAAENNMTTSKGGAGITESPVDKLKKTAKADIIMQLTWVLNTVGPKKSVTFTLQGLDAYTDKQIATATGTGAQTISSEVPLLLEEAVLSHMDNFNASLQKHFDDLFENGREVIVRIKTFDSWGEDLNSEFGGKELTAIIEDWVAANTVKNRFSMSDATENMILFEQVRIPLYGANGRATDTRAFVKLLQDELKTKYAIPSKLTMKGLGQAVLIIGDK
jgi:Family of unknown function (DUF6175)